MLKGILLGYVEYFSLCPFVSLHPLKTSDLKKAEADIKRALILDPNSRYLPVLSFSN
uniref:Uncharacterized protein n=1 Tax=Lotus japonicus TaxID=34305 RepID=I3S211_LOTJA|nr:unknown [Lotus japonicus]